MQGEVRIFRRHVEESIWVGMALSLGSRFDQDQNATTLAKAHGRSEVRGELVMAGHSGRGRPTPIRCGTWV